MAGKQPKQNYLTINEQFKLIKVQQNEKLSQRKLADRFNCSKTQVQHILKRKQDVIDEYENSLSHKRKLVKVKLQCPKTDAYAYEWFQRAREFKIPISGPILKQKAGEFSRRVGEQFSKSNGWLESFRKSMIRLIISTLYSLMSLFPNRQSKHL